MSFWNILKPRGLRSSRAILARKSRFDSQYSCDKRFLFRFSFLLFTVASWFFWFWNVFLFRNVRNFNLFKSERNSNNTLKTDMKMSFDENVQYYWRTMRKLCSRSIFLNCFHTFWYRNIVMLCPRWNMEYRAHHEWAWRELLDLKIVILWSIVTFLHKYLTLFQELKLNIS